MVVLEALALTIVTAAAGLYVYRAYSAYPDTQAQQRAIERSLNPPELGIAKLLGEARRTMSPEECQKLEYLTFAEVLRNCLGL